LIDVLTVLVVWFDWLTVPQIASSLGVDPAVVKGVVFGPARPLFFLLSNGDVHLSLEVRNCLQDANRAGEFYIPPKDLNPNYISLHATIRKIRSS